MGLRGYLQYLKDNPDEAKRLDQCFNCKYLKTCTLEDDEAEDENKMCKYFVSVAEVNPKNKRKGKQHGKKKR